MTIKSVDLVIIGAGATGASVAYEATKRGLKVALIDAGDIAGGTSCRSSKLLHGGVRYLELAFKTLDLSQLSLVREALLERGYWLEQAPFLATKLELALPTENCLDKAYYRIGLGLYDALAGKESIGSSRVLSRNKLSQTLPLLRNSHSGGVAYSDGQFDDARLNLLLALTAERAGAIIRTHCSVVGFEHREDGSLSGVISQNTEGQQELWHTNTVVNATGIESDKLRQMVDPSVEPRMLTSRGMHIVIKESLCPKGIGLLIPSTDDGRILFVLPFFGSTLVGTTETACGIEDARSTSKTEKDYLLKHLKRWFPSLKQPIVQSSWAGGRPLVKPSNSNVDSSRVVREHQIETLPCGMISAMGGKWTTCRSIAIDTLTAIEAWIERPLLTPNHLPLIGTDPNSVNTKPLLKKQLTPLRECLPDTPIREKQLAHLQKKYGLEALQKITTSQKNEREPLSDVIPLSIAEIDQAIKEEHAQTPTDVLARRCRLAMIDIDEAKRILPIVQDRLLKAKLPGGELNLEK